MIRTVINPASDRLYWLEALQPEAEAIWGRHRLYGNDETIEQIAYYMALTSFYDDSRRDIANRRRLLYHFLATGMSTVDPDDPLRMYSSTLPIDSWVAKTLRSIAIAYNDPPEYVFAGQGDEPSPAALAYQQAYQRFGMFGRLQAAYRYGKLCSGCLVGPYISGAGDQATPKVQIVPPDMFACQVDPLDPDVLVEVALPVTMLNGRGNPETHFQIWHADTYHVENYKGNPVRFEDENGDMVDESPNRYGRIPFELLRLTEPANDELLSGGLFPLVEANIACNGTTFMADHNMLYNGFAQWVAYNLDWVKNNAKLGAGRLLTLENVKGAETGEAEGRLDVVSPPSQYDRIDDMKRRRKQDSMRDLDIPESMIADAPGTPPSGISRLIERLGLLGQRRDDILHLAPFERRLMPLVQEVWNQDYARDNRALQLPDAELEDVIYHDEPIYGDPDADRKGKIYDVQVAVVDGKITREMAVGTATIVYGFTEEEAAVLFPAPEEAAEEPQGNDSELRGSVGGSAQVAALQASYYKGEMPREAAIANLEVVFGFSNEEASRLFIEVPPEPPVDPTAAPEEPAAPIAPTLTEAPAPIAGGDQPQQPEELAP